MIFLLQLLWLLENLHSFCKFFRCQGFQTFSLVLVKVLKNARVTKKVVSALDRSLHREWFPPGSLFPGAASAWGISGRRCTSPWPARTWRQSPAETNPPQSTKFILFDFNDVKTRWFEFLENLNIVAMVMKMMKPSPNLIDKIKFTGAWHWSSAYSPPTSWTAWSIFPNLVSMMSLTNLMLSAHTAIVSRVLVLVLETSGDWSLLTTLWLLLILYPSRHEESGHNRQ